MQLLLFPILVFLSLFKLSSGSGPKHANAVEGHCRLHGLDSKGHSVVLCAFAHHSPSTAAARRVHARTSIGMASAGNTNHCAFGAERRLLRAAVPQRKLYVPARGRLTAWSSVSPRESLESEAFVSHKSGCSCGAGSSPSSGLV